MGIKYRRESEGKKNKKNRTEGEEGGGSWERNCPNRRERVGECFVNFKNTEKSHQGQNSRDWEQDKNKRRSFTLEGKKRLERR